MKQAKCFLFLGVFVFSLSLLAGESEVVLEKASNRLIGQANPGVSGIGAVKMVVTPSGEEKAMDSAFWKGLEVKVGEKLKGSGLKVYDPNQSDQSAMAFDMPEFIVDIDVLRFEGEQVFFSIRASLARPVYIVISDAGLGGVKPGVMVKAAVWTVASSIIPATTEDLRGRITEAALQQAEAFIAVWVGSIPPDKMGPNANATIVEKRASDGPVGSASSEGQYVGSKNSSVFHSAGCQSVKRISAKNLVVYKTRSEAIKAGKRPCKVCKP